MQGKNNNTKALIISILALGMVAITSTSFAKENAIKNASEDTMEKCMGLVKAGMGDGKATVDGKIEEWIFVPISSCAKFVDGRVYIGKK